MWCIGDLTPEYRRRMYEILGLYGKKYNKSAPVICVDEKSKQLIGDTISKPPLPMRPGMVRKIDYEYKRNGTCNFFVAVEPKGGKRYVPATSNRTKQDFVNFISYLTGKYSKANKIHIVLDNLNTHFRKSFEDILGLEKTAKLFARIELHHTPIHASRLNMAEIEIGVLDKQCLNRRIDNFQTIEKKAKE
jgi:hypothetical protein